MAVFMDRVSSLQGVRTSPPRNRGEFSDNLTAILNKDMERSFQIQKCPRCLMRIYGMDMETHLNDECIERPVACPYNSGWRGPFRDLYTWEHVVCPLRHYVSTHTHFVFPDHIPEDEYQRKNLNLYYLLRELRPDKLDYFVLKQSLAELDQ